MKPVFRDGLEAGWDMLSFYLQLLHAFLAASVSSFHRGSVSCSAWCFSWKDTLVLISFL